jgi:hypothetical protein
LTSSAGVGVGRSLLTNSCAASSRIPDGLPEASCPILPAMAPPVEVQARELTGDFG